MSPKDTVDAIVISNQDESCDCGTYVQVLHAKSQLRQADAYHTLTVICGSCICLMVMSFFGFLMAAAWFERHVSVETSIVATIFGMFASMCGILFGLSKKKVLVESVNAIIGEKKEE